MGDIERIVVSREEFDRITALLDEDAEPVPALVELIRRVRNG